MGKHIKDAGHYVTLAMDGREGVATVFKRIRAGKTFDIIFMDMDMPRMNGFEATRKLREKGYNGTIVALTALDLPTDRRRCLDAGCNDYSAKPISKPKLFAILDYHLKQKSPDPNQQ